MEEKKNQLDKLENDIAALYESMRENEEALSGKKAQKHELELLNSGLDSEITVCENKILNIGQNISRLSSEAEALLQQAQGQADEFGKLQKAIEGLLQEEQRLEEAVAAAARESNEASARLGEKNAEIEAVRAEISSLSQKAAGAENKMKSYDILLQSFKSRQTAVADDLAAAATEEKTLQARKKTQEAALEKTQKALEAATQEAQEKSNEAASLAAKTREMEAAYNDLSVAVSQKQSRHRLLSELERDLDGYSFGVKSILKNKNEIPGAKIWGVLGKLIKVPDVYVTAIEVALAAAAQNVVVETEDDAKAAIGYLKSKKPGG